MNSLTRENPLGKDVRLVLGRSLPSEGTTAALFLAATLLSVLVQLLFLDRYPAHFVDESWFSSAVWHWVVTGENVDQLHRETLDPEVVGKTRFYLGQLPWFLSFNAFGLGFFQARLASWVVGILLLLLLLRLGQQTYGLLTGALAVLLLSLDPSFIQASHYARQDVLLALFGVAALSLALEAVKRESWWLHVVAGCVAGLTLEIHQNGIIFILAFAALYLREGGRRFLGSSATWLACLGGVLGCLVFAWFHLLPSPAAYFGYNSFDLSRGHQPPILSLSPVRLFKSLLLERYRLGFEADNLGLTLMVAAAVAAAWRRSRADRSILLYVGVGFLASVLFLGKKSDLYAILTTPFLVLLLAEMFVSLGRSARVVETRRIAAALLLVFLGVRTFVLADALFDNRQYDYEAASHKVAQIIGDPSARVMALPTWWLGMRDFEFTSSINLVYSMKKEGKTLAEAMTESGPDILVVDEQFRDNLVDFDAPDSSPRTFELPIAEYEEYMDEHAVLLDEFFLPQHGRVEIFALRKDRRPLTPGGLESSKCSTEQQ